MGLVLVIDDEKDILDNIQEILELDSHTVHTASNAAVAFDKIMQTQYDLIVSDVLMPGMTGLDLLKKLRSLKNRPPVIFVSASDAEETLVKALEYGAADFISKPFVLEELRRLVVKMVKVGQLTKN